MIIYLIRHADSLCNTGLSEKEKNDIGLSDFGIYQAKALASGLKKNNIDKIYSSPIKRAKETAFVISNYLGVEVDYSDNLREFCADQDVKDEKKQKELKIDSFINKDLIMPSGESYKMAVNRLFQFIKTVFKEQTKYKNICIISHRMVIEGFLQEKFKINKNSFNWLDNATVTALSVDDFDEINLLYFNKSQKDMSLLWQIFKRKIRYLFK